MVRCAVGKAAVIGPYFFENINGNAVTVNSKRYTKMINNFFVPELRWKCVPIWRVVSVEWSDDPHSQSINGCALPSFRWPPHFQVCCHSLGPLVPRYVHLWLFLIRIPQGMCVWAQAPYTGGFKRCWREWRPTSKNTSRNASMEINTIWRILFSKLKFVKC